MAKPPITANQVTFLRLILLPIGGALFYFGLTAQWINLVFMTLLGCTDFVDGWLARKYGSTELGRLMDPIADKVFVVVIFVPFIDLAGCSPGGATAALPRVRHHGLRSTYERLRSHRRPRFWRRSKHGRRWQAAAFFHDARRAREAMFYVLLAGTVLPVAATLVRYLVTGYLWRVSFIMAGWFGVLLALPFLPWQRRRASSF